MIDNKEAIRKLQRKAKEKKRRRNATMSYNNKEIESMLDGSDNVTDSKSYKTLKSSTKPKSNMKSRSKGGDASKVRFP